MQVYWKDSGEITISFPLIETSVYIQETVMYKENVWKYQDHLGHGFSEALTQRRDLYCDNFLNKINDYYIYISSLMYSMS